MLDLNPIDWEEQEQFTELYEPKDPSRQCSKMFATTQKLPWRKDTDDSDGVLACYAPIGHLGKHYWDSKTDGVYHD